MLRFTFCLLGLCPLLSFGASPMLSGEFVFPPEKIHNHSSSIVELPGGDLFLCWYHGSGERKADDVKVEASRMRKGKSGWAPRFTLADTPNFPDTNPALFVDSRQRLWLLWPLIVANEWHTAVMKYRIYSNYRADSPPKMDFADNIFFIPPNFAAKV
ncbi:MAG: neuraminidase (sialidase)-like protein, partial [Acidobacteria bacterium]|nr:neuraminidase (sialidase)-like protein [Acidobacteriota bacterium]